MMKMSRIMECQVSDCSYNMNKKCHTLAITVGDSGCPCCDTFVDAHKKGGDSDTIAGVGACKSENCMHNKSLECMADSIVVGMHSGHPDCQTFAAR